MRYSSHTSSASLYPDTVGDVDDTFNYFSNGTCNQLNKCLIIMKSFTSILLSIQFLHYRLLQSPPIAVFPHTRDVVFLFFSSFLTTRLPTAIKTSKFL